MYSPYVGPGSLAVTGLTVAHYTLAGVVLIALGLSLMALVPRRKNKKWKN